MEHDKIIVHCPTEEDARTLFNYWNLQGVMWADGKPLSFRFNWNDCKEETCYYRHNNRLKYGDRESFEANDEYCYIKICSVDDIVDYPDFEVASDFMLKELLSI